MKNSLLHAEGDVRGCPRALSTDAGSGTANPEQKMRVRAVGRMRVRALVLLV